MQSSISNRILSALSWAPVGVLISDTIATIHVVRTDSLTPAIQPNTPVLVTRARASSLARGDAVLLAHGAACRLSALPGDRVRDAAGRMRVVPSGFVWVMGRGSEGEGRVPVAMVVGKIARRLPTGERVERVAVDNVFPPRRPYS